MSRLFILISLLCFKSSFGQAGNRKDCKIEFYLLKTRKPGLNPNSKLVTPFLVEPVDLADTAFIKDTEILGCTFKKDTLRRMDSIFIQSRQMFEVPASVTKRINKLNIPICCGRQFALVINGKIVYSGYFWNRYSSWGCDALTAVAMNTEIEISRTLPDYYSAVDSKDTRRNRVLMDCLKETNRLRNK